MKEERGRTHGWLTFREIGRVFTFAGLVMFLFVSASVVEAREMEPDPLVQQALASNPELKSIDHKVQALRRNADAVLKWMDPVFMVEYGSFPCDTWSLGDSPMTGLQFKLQQTITLAGENSRREAAAQAAAEAKTWSLGEKRNQLAAQIRRGYWNLALVRQLRGITDSHVNLVCIDISNA